MVPLPRRAAFLSLMLAAVFPLFPQDVLRGEVRVDLEPVYAAFLDAPYPLDTKTAQTRALEEAAMFFSAMIYGWSFNYDIGEKARGIAEEFELTPLGTIPFGDAGLMVTGAGIRNMRLYMWADYRLTAAQKRRIGMWRAGTVQNAQAVGYGPLGRPAGAADWLSIKRDALEDAARAAVRAVLRGGERNRPKEARGFIALAAFPSYWMDAGQWAASARFRVQITEITPFAAY